MTWSGLLDTSVFIAQESRRPLDVRALPDEAFVCVITVAELEAGVLAAPDLSTRHRRLTTLRTVTELQPLVVDEAAASRWAMLRVRLHETGRRINVNDLWIASIALANSMPIVTQDDDFDVLAELGLADVIKV